MMYLCSEKKRRNMKLISWNVNGLRACEGKGFSNLSHFSHLTNRETQS